MVFLSAHLGWRYVGALVAVFAVAGLLAETAYAQDGLPPHPIFTLPLVDNPDGALHVEVAAGRVKPLALRIDTAAATSILFEHRETKVLKRRLKLIKDELKPVYFPFTNILLDFQPLETITLSFGKHSYTSNTWVYGPWRPTGLFPGQSHPTYDGIAGRDVLVSFAVAVDHRRSEISFYESGGAMHAFYDHTLPLELVGSLVTMPIEYQTANGTWQTKRMVLDTGFNGVILFADEAQLEELQAQDTDAPAETMKAAMFQQGFLRFADTEPVAGRVIITSKGGFPADGVMGTDFLNRFQYALDVGAKHFYFSNK